MRVMVRRHIQHVRVLPGALLFGLAIAMSFPATLWSQTLRDEFEAFEPAERSRLEQRLAEHARSQEKVQQALDRSQKALALAERLNDPAAMPIARQAVMNSQQALARIQAATARDEQRLAALARTRSARAESGSATPGAHVSLHEGTVLRGGGKSLEAPLAPGDVITTGPNARVEVVFQTGERVELGPNARLEVVADEPGRRIVQLLKGTLHNLARCLRELPARCNYTLVRGNRLAGSVRGTEYEFTAGEDGSEPLVVLSGSVSVEDRVTGQQFDVRAHERLAISKDGRVSGPTPVDARSIQRWWHLE